MRTETRIVYVAFDGEEFGTVAECREYEKAHIHLALLNLTVERIEAALSRTDADLADAIEQTGLRIRQTRIAAGDLKRERRKGLSVEAEADVIEVSAPFKIGDDDDRDACGSAPSSDDESIPAFLTRS